MVGHALRRAELEAEIPLMIIGTVDRFTSRPVDGDAEERDADRADIVKGPGERAGLDVIGRRQSNPRVPQELVQVPVGERGAHAEVGHHFTVDAEHHFLGAGRGDVADAIRRCHAAGVVEIDVVRSLRTRREVDLAQRSEAVTAVDSYCDARLTVGLTIDGVVIDVCVRLNRRDERRGVRRQLRSE